MPKTYPVEVRGFALGQRAEGHPWERVRELVRDQFGIDPPPCRRQMQKWVKSVARGNPLVPGLVEAWFAGQNIDIEREKPLQMERAIGSETSPTNEAQPLVLSVARAAQLLGVSRNFAYLACARGQIPCVRIGGRILVPISTLQEFLRGEWRPGAGLLPRAGSAPP